MLPLLTSILALVLILAGTAASVLGILGYYRLPDVFTRLHATGMVGTFGVTLLVGATVFAAGVAWPKAILLAVLILIAGPCTSHALASAAYRIRLPLHRSARFPHRDDLEQDTTTPPNQS